MSNVVRKITPVLQSRQGLFQGRRTKGDETRDPVRRPRGPRAIRVTGRATPGYRRTRDPVGARPVDGARHRQDAGGALPCRAGPGLRALPTWPSGPASGQRLSGHAGTAFAGDVVVRGTGP